MNVSKRRTAFAEALGNEFEEDLTPEFMTRVDRILGALHLFGYGVREASNSFEQADSMQAGLCDCGCGGVAIILMRQDDTVIASGKMQPQGMLRFCESISDVAREQLRK